MTRILIAASFLAWCPGLPGQTASPRAFEVASVKLNTSLNNAIGNKFGPDSVRWTNTPLKVLIEETYRLRDYQVIGGPAWLDSDRWDIDARAAGPASTIEKNEMTAALLADRFQLRFHQEIRQLPIYRMVVAKGGPKLTPAKEQDADHRGTTPGRGSLRMTGATIQQLARWLSTQLNLPIVENTGLTGRYDLNLEWALGDSQEPSVDAPAAAGKLPVLAAVEYQLGLKLESTRGPVEVLIVDHVEKASGN